MNALQRLLTKHVRTEISLVIIGVTLLATLLSISSSSNSFTADSGTVYWVATNGSDSNSGTAAAPFATVQKAADVAPSGATVIIKDGSYRQAATLTFRRGGTASLPIVVRAEHAGQTIILGPQPLPTGQNQVSKVIKINAPYITLDGLIIQNGPAGGINVNAAHITIRNSTISENGWAVTTVDGGSGILTSGNGDFMLVEQNRIFHNREHGVYASQGPDDVEIRQNEIDHNGVNGIQSNPAGGSPPMAYRMNIHNNILHDNGSRALNASISNSQFINNLLYGQDRPITLAGSASNLFAFNTIVGGRNDVVLSGGNSNNSFFANIMHSTTGTPLIYANGDRPSHSDYNLFLGANANTMWNDPGTRYTLAQWQSAFNLDLHSISANPGFVNSSAGDYHLNSSSPAINRIASLPDIIINQDLLGHARFFNGSSDIGAYEYGSTSTGGDNQIGSGYTGGTGGSTGGSTGGGSTGGGSTGGSTGGSGGSGGTGGSTGGGGSTTGGGGSTGGGSTSGGGSSTGGGSTSGGSGTGTSNTGGSTGSSGGTISNPPATNNSGGGSNSTSGLSTGGSTGNQTSLDGSGNPTTSTNGQTGSQSSPTNSNNNSGASISPDGVILPPVAPENTPAATQKPPFYVRWWRSVGGWAKNFFSIFGV